MTTDLISGRIVPTEVLDEQKKPGSWRPRQIYGIILPNMQPLSRETIYLRGRPFSPTEISLIAQIIKAEGHHGRSHVSRRVCEALRWFQLNGRLKDRACRDVLRELEQMGLISLPPPLTKRNSSSTLGSNSEPKDETWPTYELQEPVDLAKIEVRQVRGTSEEPLWNHLVQAHHYLGYKLSVGKYVKHLAFLGQTPVACLGWGEAARALGVRDNWIGWSAAQRELSRHLIVDNTRFLICPWAHLRNLGSRVMSLAVKRLPADWMEWYAYEPVLLETFIDAARFDGAMYKASNWTCLGLTKGIGRKGGQYEYHGRRKWLYVLELNKRTRIFLTEGPSHRMKNILSRR